MKKIYIIFVVLILALFVNYLYVFNKSFYHEYKSNKVTLNDSIRDYIISVVSCEMPALYDDEALKAQAVAARTYYYYTINHNKEVTNDDQCTLSKEELKNKWGSDYNKYYNKISNLVDEVSNIVMYKDNNLFKSFYFSTSNGTTEDSITVFNEGNIKSVDSSWDENSKDYLKETIFTKEELINILGNFNSITINKRSNTNHVLEVNVDNKTYTGIEFRKLLKLRSTDFNIDIIDNQYKITTKGYGHGVGLSQYGANYLANKGYTYEEILKYYYNNIDIKEINV